MLREVMQPKGIWDTRPRFAQVVRMGNQVYIAGQTSVDAKGNVVGKGDIEAQTRQVFRNLQKCLEAAGMGFDRVAKLNIYSTNLDAHFGDDHQDPKGIFSQGTRRQYNYPGPPSGSSGLAFGNRGYCRPGMISESILEP